MHHRPGSEHDGGGDDAGREESDDLPTPISGPADAGFVSRRQNC